MRRSPLVALLLSFSFALQLALARDGTTCVMAGAAHDGMAMAGQTAVDMSAMDMSLDVASDGAPQESSCDHESATTACLVMAPCTSGFVVVAATVDDDAAVLPERAVPATIVMPPSVNTPPELPPPRA